MTIDWTAFTPYASLAGGALIGAAAALLLLANGRIAGISGVLGGLLKPGKGDVAWRLAFVLGLIGAPAAYGLIAPHAAPTIDAGGPLLVVSGLMIGVGTRYGSGCTSGHGVCGLSRRSLRSLAATCSFMGVGFLTVFLVRHLLAA